MQIRTTLGARHAAHYSSINAGLLASAIASAFGQGLFTMAKIQRIGRDHHTPFQVIVAVVVVVVVVVVLVLVLQNQAVTRGENKLPHD